MHKTVELHRFGFGAVGTLGRLRVLDHGVEEFSCFTIERPVFPWVRENEPAQSAIPCGRYPLMPGTFHNSTPDAEDDYPCLVVDQVPGRSLIKIHAGNTARNSRGCPLVGDSIGFFHNLPAVFSSRKTLAALLVAFGDRSGELIVAELREGL